MGDICYYCDIVYAGISTFELILDPQYMGTAEAHTSTMVHRAVSTYQQQDSKLRTSFFCRLFCTTPALIGHIWKYCIVEGVVTALYDYRRVKAMPLIMSVVWKNNWNMNK